MQLQHVNVKLLVKSPDEVPLEPLIPVFHSWIQGQVLEELLLDVADYRHVPAGPGVVLIGHQANYSVDDTDDRLGVRYNRKAEVDGGNQNALRQAMRASLIACQRLKAEPSLERKLQFNGHETGDGELILKHAGKLGFEGVVSKTIDAPYAPGNRGLWRKAKALNRQEFVVVGWSDPEGSRPSQRQVRLERTRSGSGRCARWPLSRSTSRSLPRDTS